MSIPSQCLKCSGQGIVKSGHIWDKPRYRCKHCGCQFTREEPKGHSERTKTLAIVLYLSGLSMNMIGKIIGVTAQSVMRWIKIYGKKA